MENYIGANLKFETTFGSIEGTLREIRKQDGILMIEDHLSKEKLKEISISEIKQLEIIKRKEELSKKVVIEPVKAQKETFRDFVTNEEARKILSDAFSNSYPTEEAFLSIVSINILKIVLNVFKCKAEDRVAVLIGGDDVFSRLGYFLAIHLFNAGLSPYVNSPVHTSPETAAIVQRFKNSGYKVSKASEQYKLVVLCSEVDKGLLKTLSYQNLFFCELPEDTKEPGTKYGLVYGAKTDRVPTFNGKVFCIDVGLPEEFLKKYKLKRQYPSSVFCLPSK